MTAQDEFVALVNAKLDAIEARLTAAEARVGTMAPRDSEQG